MTAFLNGPTSLKREPGDQQIGIKGSALQQEAFLSLFMANRGALLDYANGILGNRAYAEEVVQEAWLRFEQATTLQVLSEPLSYLYRIVRNLAVDDKRRMQRESKVIAGHSLDAMGDIVPDNQPSPEAMALHRNEFDLLMEAIAELPERTRIAVDMHRFGGCKLREIAVFLGVSPQTAHVLVSEGVQHCKRRLMRP